MAYVAEAPRGMQTGSEKVGPTAAGLLVRRDAGALADRRDEFDHAVADLAGRGADRPFPGEQRVRDVPARQGLGRHDVQVFLDADGERGAAFERRHGNSACRHERDLSEKTTEPAPANPKRLCRRRIHACTDKKPLPVGEHPAPASFYPPPRGGAGLRVIITTARLSAVLSVVVTCGRQAVAVAACGVAHATR